MAFPDIVYLQQGDQFKQRTLAQGPLYIPGQKGMTANGDIYRYAQVGAVAMVVGKLYQAPIPVTNHVLQTAAAAAVGATTVAVTLGNTAVVANDYINGNLVVDLASNTGFGYIYTIDAHPAVAGSGVFTVPLAGSPSRTIPTNVAEGALLLTGSESVQVAIATTANSVSLIPNNWKKVILSVVNLTTAVLAGVSVVAAAIGSWCWIKTRGNAMVLTDNTTVVIGAPAITSTVTAGAVSLLTTTNVITSPVIGIFTRVAASASYSTVFLQID